MKKTFILILLSILTINVIAQDKTQPVTLYYSNLEVTEANGKVTTANVESEFHFWTKGKDEVKFCMTINGKYGCTTYYYMAKIYTLRENTPNQILYAFMAIDDKKQETYYFEVRQNQITVKNPNNAVWIFY